MLTRDEALTLLRGRVTDPVLLAHSLETEAVMRALARRLGRDEELWGLTGLLHDLDFEEMKEAPHRHTEVTVAVLREKGFPDEALQAVREHNWDNLGIEKQSEFGIALSAGETITGLLVATALVMPDKKLASVKSSSVRKKMKTPAFARAVRRDAILEIEKARVPLDEFIELSLSAVQDIAAEVGL